ncbi:MAG: type II secretion system protein [Candidatus Accumulibacter sp.]|nr:type II secretion system protein [Accumulibacter sp.]
MRRAFNAADFPRRRRLRGVTLVEMIVVIVVSGILLSIVGMFTRNQIASYIDVANRTELADAADTALRRMAREIQSALPNSVRPTTVGNVTVLEFVPIKDAGRYRAQKGSAGGEDLDFSATADTFDVLGPPVQVAAGDWLAIYNLGIPGADVYEGSSRRELDGSGTLSSLKFKGTPFPLASPQSRFQIVDGPVSYVCDPNQKRLLRYSGYGFKVLQPVSAADFGVAPAILTQDVAECSLAYAAAVLQRNGLVSMRLKLTRNGESVELLHQVDVMNSP